jgi:hypothetical protein
VKLTAYCIIIVLCASGYCYGQKADSTLTNIEGLPNKYFSKVNKKMSSIDRMLTKKTSKYLSKSERLEKKMLRKLKRINPKEADSLMALSSTKYKNMSSELTSKLPDNLKSKGREYIPRLDSLSTSLSFLSKNKEYTDEAKKELEKLNGLQGKLQQSEKVKQFIKERKEQMKQALARYSKLPTGLRKEYDKLNRNAYYYSAQIKEYKDMLKDPAKLEKKALALLRTVPAFQKFMKENGELSRLFPQPAGFGTMASLTGLQTLDEVSASIRKQFGPNAMQMMQQSIGQARGEMDKLKNKINELGGGSSDTPLPDAFKPNTQKTKSFRQRLEYSFDVQFGKTNKYIPSGSNVAAGVGYKINDKSTVGIGISYKIGFGTIQHIRFSSEGVGFRSFIDYKIKRSFFLKGGAEMNYNSNFKNIKELQNANAWQSSALLGLSKKYKVTKKLKGNLQILYDFLYNNHKPSTQPLVFRVGYNL